MWIVTYPLYLIVEGHSPHKRPRPDTKPDLDCFMSKFLQVNKINPKLRTKPLDYPTFPVANHLVVLDLKAVGRNYFHICYRLAPSSEWLCNHFINFQTQTLKHRFSNTDFETQIFKHRLSNTNYWTNTFKHEHSNIHLRLCMCTTRI